MLTKIFITHSSTMYVHSVLNVSTTWASLASISLLAVSIIYLHHFYILYISAVLVG